MDSNILCVVFMNLTCLLQSDEMELSLFLLSMYRSSVVPHFLICCHLADFILATFFI